MSKETIEQLQQRYTKFNKQQIRVQTQLEEAQKRLVELQDRAKLEFGTDDINELQAKLESMKKENEKKRAEYQKGLDQIETKLKAVEDDFAEVGIED